LSDSKNVKHGGDPFSTYTPRWIQGEKIKNAYAFLCCVWRKCGEDGQDLKVFLLAYEMDDPRGSTRRD